MKLLTNRINRVRSNGRYKFNYPSLFVTLPEYTAHAGQAVTVVRKLDAAQGDNVEPDNADMECMYRIRAADGWEGDAFESELTTEEPL